MHGVAIGDDVYMGGGVVENDKDGQSVFKYDTVKDEWTRLADHRVFYFGLCHFLGELVSAGGATLTGGQPTGKVYRYSKADSKWIEYLKPMITERAYPALITTASAIVACGGRTKGAKQQLVTLATVEVYTSGNTQWYEAEQLPQPCTLMSSAILNASGFLLGGHDPNDKPSKSSFTIEVETLIDRARSSDIYLYSSSSTWTTLPDTPLQTSTVVAIGGRLLALGGYDGLARSTVYAFEQSTNSWIWLPFGNLPNRRYASTALQLPNDRLMIAGGRNTLAEDTCSVYIGTIIKTHDTSKEQPKTSGSPIIEKLTDSDQEFQPSLEDDDSSSNEDSYLSVVPSQVLPPYLNQEPSWAPQFFTEKGIVVMHQLMFE